MYDKIETIAVFVSFETHSKMQHCQSHTKENDSKLKWLFLLQFMILLTNVLRLTSQPFSLFTLHLVSINTWAFRTTLHYIASINIV